MSNPSASPAAGSVKSAAETGRFSADAYADRLMEELFQDVETLLAVEPVETATVRQPDVRPMEAEPPVAPTAEAPASVELALPPTAPDPLSTTASEAAMVEPPPPVAVPVSEPSGVTREARSPNAYDRLLLGVGCLSVIVSLGVWLMYQETNRKAVVMVPPQTMASPSTESNSEFAEYVQQALQNIDHQTQQGVATNSVPPSDRAGTTTTLPTVTIPKTEVPTPLAKRAATGLERIYVPVYQIPPNLYPQNRAISPLPNIPGVAKHQPPVPTAAPKKTAARPTVTVTRKLVGVLEQGNNSVALFEVNGVTQRYGIGESIGSSGWTLVEVSKDQALIRRNGEVRSLFVGHSF